MSMKSKFSTSSIIVFILGIPASFLFALLLTPSGWAAGIYLSIGLSIAFALTITLAGIGLIREESTNGGSIVVLIFSIIGASIFSGRLYEIFSSDKRYEERQQAQSKSLFSEEAWLRITDDAGCPKNIGTGDAGKMTGLWARGKGGVALVRENGLTTYYSEPIGSRKCYSKITDVGITSLTDSRFVYTTGADNSCNYALPLTIEGNSEATVTINVTYPAGAAKSGATRQNTWTWTRLGDALDHPDCADLTKEEIDTIEEREHRKDPSLKEYYRDRDFQNNLITPQDYYGDVYDIVTQRLRSCEELTHRAGQIDSLQPHRNFRGGAVRPRGNRTFRFDYVSDKGKGTLEIDDLVDQQLLDEHYKSGGYSLDRIIGKHDQTTFTVRCVKEHRLNQGYINEQIAESVKGENRAVIPTNSPTLKLEEIDGVTPEGQFVYLDGGSSVKLKFRYTAEFLFVSGTSLGSSKGSVKQDTDTKSICIKVEPGRLYKFAANLINQEGAWVPTVFYELSSRETMPVENVQCQREQ